MEIHLTRDLALTLMIEGSKRTTSTSKIRNTMVIKKKRKENGTRKSEFLSNPHSKGDLFSRLIIPFLAKIIVKINTTVVILKINRDMIIS